MARLSELCRGDFNTCVGCRALESHNYCPYVGTTVDWYINNDRMPLKCPKRKKKE